MAKEDTQLQGAEAATNAVRAHTSPRMRKLALLRAYVRGEQYAGLPSWYNKDYPVWEREPCVVWMAPSSAIDSNEDLLLGEGRYPAVTSRPEEDDGDEDEMLDEESSKTLDAFIRHLESEADLRAHQRAQYNNAQSVGTCVGIFGARNGRLFADVVDAEYCTTTFDQFGDVAALEIKYPYIDTYKDNQGKWCARARVFRRVIDANRDVTFLPAEATADGIEPKWKEDPAKSVTHALGFCPVVSHLFRCVSSIVNVTDGHAIHERVTDELDAFNYEASTRHEGAMYSLPQKIEIGVQPGYNPTGEVVITTPSSVRGGAVNPVSNPATGHYISAGGKSRPPMGARKQGPGHVWQYENENAKVQQLELNPGALEALANTMADLRARICESLAWVPLNPEEIKFAAALSGKALERLMARQLNRVAKDRDGFGKGYLLKSYCMLLRVAQRLGPQQLRTRGLKKAKSILDSFYSEQDGTQRWADPPLSLQWGAWFQPIPEDDEKLVKTTKEAYEAKFITLRTVVEKLRRVFGIEDVNAYLEALEKEMKERAEQEAKREADMLKNSIASAHEGLDGAAGKRAGEGKPKPNSQDRGSGAGPASVPPKKDGKD